MKLTRKIYLSIFTTMFILLTCVATTFAWVGMFSSSTLGSFDLNLKVQDPEDVLYLLQISSSGDLGTFDDEVSLSDIQMQIMDNMNINYASESDESGYSQFNSYSDYINTRFARNAELTPVTPSYNSNSDFKVDLSKFYEFENLQYRTRQLKQSKKFFKFDLYLTVDAPSGIQVDTNINANVFFENIVDALVGSPCGGDLATYEPFSNVNPLDSQYGVLANVGTTVKTNPKNATRLAFEIFNPINISESYTGTESPVKTIIYQGGTQLPSYDSSNGVYNFGGILPEEYNLAIKEMNTTFKSNIDIDNVDSEHNYLYESALYRYNNSIDKEMTLDNWRLWEAPSQTDITTNPNNPNFLGAIGTLRTKIKITCYFWFEGWDADCLRFIDKKNVTINLVFSTDRKE